MLSLKIRALLSFLLLRSLLSLLLLLLLLAVVAAVVVVAVACAAFEALPAHLLVASSVGGTVDMFLYWKYFVVEGFTYVSVSNRRK